MNLNLIIADDHKIVREGISQLLQLNDDINIVGEANDGKECLKLLNNTKADILLLDIHMPNIDGFQVLAKIRKDKLPIKIIMLTAHDEVDYLIRAVDLGADGYLLKSSGYAELQKAIFSVSENKEYIQPDLIPKLNSKLLKRENEKSKVDSLTKRELEVLILVSHGFLNRDIADKLNITEQTVKNHISNIFRKIGVSDRTQAAVFAIRNNIIYV